MMQVMDHIALLDPLDFAAVGTIVVCWFLIGWMIEHPGARRPSVTILMSERRRDWMKVFVTRDPRIFDSQILGGLRQGTAFFASTCLLAIGGVLALVGNTAPLQGVAAEVSEMPVPVLIWQLKLGLVALFLTNAFLKFVWANRVFGYCAVMMAAVPNDPGDPATYPRAAQAAELNIITWTIERSGPLTTGGGWYYQTIEEVTNSDGVMYELIDVLAQDVGVAGIFSDWPATVSYYASCMGLE